MRPIVALITFLVLIGCGNAAGRGNPAANQVAGRFTSDCLRSPGPASQMATLRRLCDCTADHIRRSGIAFTDGEDAINEKIRAAQDICVREVYGDDPDDRNAAR